MPEFARHNLRIAALAGGAVASILAASAAWAAAATSGVPDFMQGGAGWQTVGTDIYAVPGKEPGPVTDHPKYPHLSNAQATEKGVIPGYRMADLNDENLTPFAVAGLKKANDMVNAGFSMVSREARCYATGVPAMLVNPGQPSFWLQTPTEITIMSQLDQEVRHIYLDVPHSANPKPSWYGESVGHFEGDTLVVDTIGENDKTFIDNFRTPHSTKIHIVERYKMMDGGKKLHVDLMIEDPATFKKPINAMHEWRQVKGPMVESKCIDGELYNPLPPDKVEPLPIATKADF